MIYQIVKYLPQVEREKAAAANSTLHPPGHKTTPFFKFRILSSRFGFKKPDVRLFDIAMKKGVIKPEESVYIGDNPPKDLIGARKAGMKFILLGQNTSPIMIFNPIGNLTVILNS